MGHAIRRLPADDAFAAALRPTRTAAGLSQVQLANRVGLPIAAVAGTEQGVRRASIGEAVAIAQALDTTVDAMVASTSGPLVKAPIGRPRRALRPLSDP